MNLIICLKFIIVVILAFVIINIIKNNKVDKSVTVDKFINSNVNSNVDIMRNSSVSMVNFMNKFNGNMNNVSNVSDNIVVGGKRYVDNGKVFIDERMGVEYVNLNKYIERDMDELMNFSNNKLN